MQTEESGLWAPFRPFGLLAAYAARSTPRREGCIPVVSTVRGPVANWRVRMVTPGLERLIRAKLLDGRKRLSATIELVPNNTNVRQLLGEVDAALDRLPTNGYGLCETCSDRSDRRQLLIDPLCRHCFSHLASEERVKILRDREFPNLIGLAPPVRGWRVVEALRAAWKILRDGADGPLEGELDAIKLLLVADDPRDREVELIRLLSVADNRELEAIKLVMAAQRCLLPSSHLRLSGWELYFDYAPAGPVGGDYCDLVPQNSGELFLFLGDVMGKGFAGSKISSQLNGVFRTLLDLKLPIVEMLERANRIFCERVQVIGYYATLVCIRATSEGTLELINAGHLPLLLLRSGGVERIESTGLSLGLLCGCKYEVTQVQLR